MIEKVKNIKTYLLSPNVQQKDMEKIPGGPVSLYDVAVKPYERKKFFKHTRLGRFLSLRTKASKSILGVIIGAATNMLPPPIGGWVGSLASALTSTQIGVPMELFEGMSLLQIAITIGSFLIVTAVPFFFKGVRDNVIYKAVEGRIDAISDALVDAVDEESDGGKKITRSEIRNIVKSAIKPNSDADKPSGDAVA